MNVMPAWNSGYTGRGVVVSILDDGIEKDHPDLKRNYVCLLNPTVSHKLVLHFFSTSFLSIFNVFCCLSSGNVYWWLM